MFYKINMPELNTASSEISNYLIDNGFKIMKKYEIKTTNFQNLLKEEKISQIDFLNIDIEGKDFELLKSIDLNNNDLISKKNEIISYFYQDLNENVLRKATIYTLVEEFRPDLIIDAVNTATVLGKAYNPCETQELFKSDIKNCCENVLVNDFTTKIINFVSGLKLAMKLLMFKNTSRFLQLV